MSDLMSDLTNKATLVAKREWFENVRTKAFWISLLLMPVILVAAIVVPVIIEKNKSARDFVVIDESGWLHEQVMMAALESDMQRMLRDSSLIGGPVDALPPPVATLVSSVDAQTQTDALARAIAQPGKGDRQGLSQQAVDGVRQWWISASSDEIRAVNPFLSKARFREIDRDGRSTEELASAIGTDDLFAYIQIADNPLDPTSVNRFVSKNLTDDDLQSWYSRLATRVLQAERMNDADISPELAGLLTAEFGMLPRKVSSSGEEEDVSAEDMLRQWAPVVFVYLLFLAIMTISQMLLSNTIEEKSNKLMEVLLSSISPLQLMIGKILGIAATGLTMILTWVGCLIGAALLVPSLFSGTQLSIDFSFLISDPVFLGSFVVYFILGYLLYASILVAIGSVCNTLKEAQNLQSPIIILLMVPLFVMIPIAEDPNGVLAKSLSYFPPATPFVMMNRAAGELAWWEYALSTGVLLVAVALTMWAAAKVFRVGVLMTGKAPSIKEMIRWIRAPIGAVPVRK